MSFSKLSNLPVLWDMALYKIHAAIDNGMIEWPEYPKAFIKETKSLFKKRKFNLAEAEKHLLRDDFPTELIHIREKLFEILGKRN